MRVGREMEKTVTKSQNILTDVWPLRIHHEFSTLQLYNFDHSGIYAYYCYFFNSLSITYVSIFYTALHQLHNLSCFYGFKVEREVVLLYPELF